MDSSQADFATPRHQRHIALQVAALLAVLSLAWPYFAWRNETLPWREVSFAVGALAFVLSSLSRHPPAWRIAHALTAPALWWLHTLTR